LSTETWSDRLRPRRLREIALGLMLGAAGGAAAEWFGVPLAWMLGALFVTMTARIAGAPIDVPIWVRAIFLILIGLFLGENFEGVDAAEFLQWPISIFAAMLYVPVAAASAFLFYRYVAGERAPTALCSAIPGGLIAVVVISSALGADERRVALAQSLRIAIVVCMAPVVAFGLLGYPAPSEATFEKHALIHLDDLAVLLAAAFAAMWGLKRLGVPIPYMIGPLLASGGLRLMGLVEGVLPHQLIEVSLVVTGSSIGTRFRDISFGRLLRYGTVTLGGTSVLMGVSALFAAVVAPLVGQDYLPVLLAYAPGGVAEMSLIALAIDANPGFVAIHHVVRILFVMVVVPLTAVALGRVRQQGG
jgi:membrane AbrB-like protein